MSLRGSLLLLLLLLPLHSVSGQSKAQIIKGTVTDSLSKASVEGAIVTLHRETSKSSPIAFALTDSKGDFDLSIPLDSADSLLLRVRLTGYKPAILPLRAQGNPLHILLSPMETALPEVIVLGAPITARGDTVSYRAETFITPTTYTLEDLLERLPGISVEASGLVKYNGEPIQGVYIEGKDLVADRYRTATRILRASDVQAVEVHEHYQRVKLLRGLEEGEGAMLNIRLKDAGMSHPSGEVTGGTGSSGKDPVYRISSDAMLIRPSTQLLASVHSGSDGRDVAYDVGGARSIPSPEVTDLLSLKRPPTSAYSTTPLSRHHGGTANQLFSLSNGHSLKYNIGYDDLHLTEERRLTSHLYDGAQDTTLREMRRERSRQREGYLTLTYLRNDSLLYLRNALHVEGELGGRQADMVRNTARLSELEQHSGIRLSDRLRMLKRREDRISEMELYIYWSSLPSLVRTVPEGPLAYETRGRGSKLHIETSLAYGFFLTPRLVINGDTRIYAFYEQANISSLKLEETSGGSLIVETGPRLLYSIPGVKWSLTVPLSVSLSRYRTVRLICHPGIRSSLSYRPSADWRLSLRGGYADREQPRLSDYLLGSYRISLDRSVVRDAYHPSPRTRSLSANLDIEYRRPLDGLFAQWSLMGRERWSSQQRDMRLDGASKQESPVTRLGHDRMLHTDIIISKYFSDIKTLTRFTTGYDYGDRSLLLRGNESRLHEHFWTIGGEVTSSLSDKWELRGRLSGAEEVQSGLFGTERSYDLTYGISLAYTPLKSLSLHADCERRELYEREGSASLTSLNAGLLYRSRKHRIELAAHNILGEDLAGSYSLDRGSRSMSFRSLRGRQVVVSYTLMY